MANGNAMKDRHSGQDQNLSTDSETDSDDDLFVNPNHIQSLVIHSDSSDGEESSSADSSVDEGCGVDCEGNEDLPIKSIIDNNNTN